MSRSRSSKSAPGLGTKAIFILGMRHFLVGGIEFPDFQELDATNGLEVRFKSLSDV